MFSPRTVGGLLNIVALALTLAGAALAIGLSGGGAGAVVGWALLFTGLVMLASNVVMALLLRSLRLPEARLPSMGEVRGMLGAVRAAGTAYSQASDHKRRERLRREGRLGTARIEGVRDTTVTVGETHLLLELTMTVTPEGGQGYPLTRRELVPRISLPRLTPRAVFPVRVDPRDRSELLIEWG